MRIPNSLRQSGFSLIEMIVAITVLGILSTSAALFLRGPITSYFDAERRVDLSDAGGLAMAKLSQDVSRAVPNSVNVAPVGAGFSLSFVPRPPSPAIPVTYVCFPNLANPALGELRRIPGNDLLATGIAACQARLPQSAPFVGSGGRSQVVSLLLNFDNAGNRLNLAHTIRVEPQP